MEFPLTSIARCYLGLFPALVLQAGELSLGWRPLAPLVGLLQLGCPSRFATTIHWCAGSTYFFALPTILMWLVYVLRRLLLSLQIVILIDCSTI